MASLSGRKVDAHRIVDGLESEIIQGGHSLLADPRLRSAMIELDVARPQLILAAANAMRDLGFTYVNEHADHGSKAAINARFDRA